MNAASVLAAVGGDRAFLREMARLYLDEDAPRLLAQLRQAAARGDFPGLEEAAHGLKGLAAEFHAEAARHAAAQIEAAARAHLSAPLAELLAAFEYEFAQLAAVLRGCA